MGEADGTFSFLGLLDKVGTAWLSVEQAKQQAKLAAAQRAAEEQTDRTGGLAALLTPTNLLIGGAVLIGGIVAIKLLKK